MTNDKSEPRYIILDTDMGCDDSWALQMLLKSEKNFRNVKILGITTVNGNTTVENVIKNTYRILDGLGRTDVKLIEDPSLSYEFIEKSLLNFRFQFIEAQLKA